MRSEEQIEAQRDLADIRLRRFVKPAPWLLAAHCLEETLLNRPAWDYGMPFEYPAGVTQVQFGITALIITLLGFGWYIAARRWKGGTHYPEMMGGLCGALLVNACFPHLYGSFVQGNYGPGVVTAAFALLPFSLFAVRELLKNGLVTRRMMAGVTLGLVAGTFVVMRATLFIAGAVAG